jgi:hypothetical protein
MAVQPPNALFNLYGFVIWGDIGPLTMYRRYDGRIVTFLKTWPNKPASRGQINQRNAYRAAATAWHALTASQRAQWTTAAARASLCMHGYNLFLHYYLTPSAATLATLQRQTGIALALPPWPTPPSIIGDFEMGWYWNKLWYTCARSFNAKKDPAGDPDYYIDAQPPGFPRHELYVRLDRITYHYELGITFYRDSEMWPSCTAYAVTLQKLGAHTYTVVAWNAQNPASLICSCNLFIAMPP